MTVSVRLSRAGWVDRPTLTVVSGPDSGREIALDGDELTIGSDARCDIWLSDATVSRRHCVIRLGREGLSIHDLGSTNGTRVGGYRVESAYLKNNALIALGTTHLRVHGGGGLGKAQTSDRLGLLIGQSKPMRRLFEQIRLVARSNTTVLIVGETGTGKELVAETLHMLSDRSNAPFAVFDCAAVSEKLIESELFGHEKGAFTGATERRVGVVESAAGGTVFLDEVGELPLELQPKLLRLLERQEVARVGSSTRKRLDIRLVAATHRDLVTASRNRLFREDLYYRLNVMTLRVPSLRERRDDIPLLANHFFRQLSGDAEAEAPPSLLSFLELHDWPGNVRELRSAIERWVLLGQPRRPETAPVMSLDMDGSPSADPYDLSCSFRAAKQRIVSDWEEGYLRKLMSAHDGNVSAAARAVKMSRNHLAELLGRYNVRD